VTNKEASLTDFSVAEQLKQKLEQTIKKIKTNNNGVAFSGGVDSSLLAKLCKDVGKNTTLLTVGFQNQTDVEVSTEVAGLLGLNLYHDLISLEELECGLKTVLSRIEFGRMVRFENCVCFYYVFKLASKQGLRTVVSANGLDELFCGYTVYKTRYGNEASMKGLMENLVDTAKKDRAEIDKLASLFGVDYLCPFLSEDFADFAVQIPLNYKIRGSDDNLRKHVLREVALNVGVPSQAALRPKKAFQYSSGIHKAVRELAKKRGFTRNKAKASGFRSEIEAYLDELRRLAEF
jgi:asparagine synthase (glutamine-hydrolysing)